MTFCDLFALDAASYNQVAAFGSDVGETVESVIADETALKHFEEFAKLTHVSESVHFLQEATEFVRTCSEDPNKIAPMAKNLYNRYICDEAENQINLPGDVHQDIVADLQNPELDIYNTAYDEIINLVRRDIFPRFKKSAQYRALLHEQDSERIKKLLERKRNESGKRATKRRGSHARIENTMIADTFANVPAPLLRGASSGFSRTSRRLTTGVPGMQTTIAGAAATSSASSVPENKAAATGVCNPIADAIPKSAVGSKLEGT